MNIWKVCTDGNLDRIRQYVLNGGNIEATDQNKQTPIMFASASGRDDIVQFFIDHGANIEAKNAHGQTPIMIATMWKQEKIVCSAT